MFDGGGWADRWWCGMYGELNWDFETGCLCDFGGRREVVKSRESEGGRCGAERRWARSCLL